MPVIVQRPALGVIGKLLQGGIDGLNEPKGSPPAPPRIQGVSLAEFLSRQPMKCDFRRGHGNPPGLERLVLEFRPRDQVGLASVDLVTSAAQFSDKARLVQAVYLRHERFQQPFDQVNSIVLREGQGRLENS